MSYMRQPYYVYHSHSTIYLPTIMKMGSFDELVVMRYAELSDTQRDIIEKRAIANHSGNFGCDALRQKHRLVPSLSMLTKHVKQVKKMKGGGK